MYQNKRGSYYIGFTSVDYELIILVRKLLGFTNAIEEYQPKNPKYRRSYTLQLGSRRIYKRLIQIGFTEAKSLTLQFPNVPDQQLPHFVRGYLDGDGCVTANIYPRKNRPGVVKHFSVRFTCGSKSFLQALSCRLSRCAGVTAGSLVVRKAGVCVLQYSASDSRQLYKFMYPTSNVPCLKRKQLKFDQGMELVRK